MPAGPKLIAHPMPVVANRPAGSKENSSAAFRRILAGRRFGRMGLQQAFGLMRKVFAA
jgi:hypothetical protein